MTPTTDDLNRNEKREIFSSYNTNKQTKAKIDDLMEAMAKVECTLGIDSTDEEKEKVNKNN